MRRDTWRCLRESAPVQDFARHLRQVSKQECSPKLQNGGVDIQIAQPLFSKITLSALPIVHRKSSRKNQILPIMDARTCPTCQYRYSPKAYLSGMFFRSLGDTWPCPDCGTELRFDRKRRLLVALGFTVWMAGLFLLKEALGLKGAQILWLLPLIPLGALFYLMDRFGTEE